MKHFNHILFLGLILILISSAISYAATLQVPSEYPTIQEAIDVAVDGDTVQVADGTYSGDGNVNLDPSGKAITIRSLSDEPEYCVIDCQKTSQGFVIKTNETPDTVIQGLTIKNGNSDSHVLDAGGGILCINASPTITNCIFSNCTAVNDEELHGSGGAISFDGCETAVDACVFTNCSAGYNGGAVNVYRSTIYMRNCTFENNQVALEGGAISAASSTVYIDESSFSENSSSGGYGGAINLARATAFVTSCTFTNNHAIVGGAISNTNSTTVIGGQISEGCTFQGNTAGEGADVFISGGESPVDARYNTFQTFPDSPYSFESVGSIIFTGSQFQEEPIEQDVYVSPFGNNTNSGLHENEPFQTIQFALSRINPTSENPITVHIAEGVYSPGTNGEIFPVPMLDHTILMGAGKHKTILSPDSMTRAIHFSEDEDVHLSNLGIQSGYMLIGAGVFSDHSEFKMSNCSISRCLAHTSAGMEIFESQVRLENVDISNNTSIRDEVVQIASSILEMNKCTVSHNTGYKGTISIGSGDTLLNDCLIAFNRNDSSSLGGGAFHCDTNLTLLNCQIVGNSSAGSSALINRGNTNLINCLITGNENRSNSRTISLSDGKVIIQHCTVAGQSNLDSPWYASVGISGVDGTIQNSIFWNGIDNEFDIDGTVEVTYCNVQNGYPGEGNINSNPYFSESIFSDFYLSNGSQGQPASPCIDAGSGPATGFDYSSIVEGMNLSHWSTTTDWIPDSGTLDMGFHWNHNQTSGVELDLSQYLFGPGDTFSLDAVVKNYTGESWINSRLFVALEVQGVFWFAPSWTMSEIDYYPMDLASGEHSIVPIIEPFVWPENTGVLYGLAFYGLATNESVSEILGGWDMVEFGYR